MTIRSRNWVRIVKNGGALYNLMTTPANTRWIVRSVSMYGAYAAPHDLYIFINGFVVWKEQLGNDVGREIRPWWVMDPGDNLGIFLNAGGGDFVHMTIDGVAMVL